MLAFSAFIQSSIVDLSNVLSVLTFSLIAVSAFGAYSRGSLVPSGVPFASDATVPSGVTAPSTSAGLSSASPQDARYITCRHAD